MKYVMQKQKAPPTLFDDDNETYAKITKVKFLFLFEWQKCPPVDLAAICRKISLINIVGK